MQKAIAALAGLLLAGAAHCSRGSHVTGTAPREGGATTGVLRAPPTTAPSIALHNLDSEIINREERAARGEDVVPELVGRYLSRARFTGRIADLIAADDATARLVAARPDEARAHMARASALSAIHEFAAASRELDVAARLGADAKQVAQERGAVLLAIGRDNEAAELLGGGVGSPPPELVMRAGLEARLGRLGDATQLFDLARAHYRDVSPFTVAWMDFERARALELAGDRTGAKPWLAEAVTVMPTYAHAVVHLSALEPPEQALPQLEAASRTSDDPDVIAAQADVLRRSGKTADAAALAQRAAARYAEVLARLPKAYADHAANFYLGMGGDVNRALDLARANADNRPTAEAVELWLTAARAAGSHDQTCAAAAKARALEHPTDALKKEAAEACP